MFDRIDKGRDQWLQAGFRLYSKYPFRTGAAYVSGVSDVGSSIRQSKLQTLRSNWTIPLNRARQGSAKIAAISMVTVSLGMHVHPVQQRLIGARAVIASTVTLEVVPADPACP